MTDRRRLARPLGEVVEECLAVGLRAVQLREKDLSVRDLLSLAASLRDLTARHGARLLVNDRADVALAIGADGVERTHASLPVSALRSALAAGARSRPGDPEPSGGRVAAGTRASRRPVEASTHRSLLIAASVHAKEEAREAEADGADIVVFGPVYDTPSKRAYGPPKGLQSLRQVVEAVHLPVLAVGGLTPARVPAVLGCGAAGVAVIGAILDAPRPGDATKAFLDALGSA